MIAFPVPFVLMAACGGSVESGTCTDDPACAQQAPVTETSPTEPTPDPARGGAEGAVPHTGASTLAGFAGDWDVAYTTKGTCTNVPDAKPTSFSGDARVTLAITDRPERLSARSDLWFACPGLELGSKDPLLGTPDLQGTCTTDAFTYSVTLGAGATPANLTIAIHQSLGDGTNGKPASCDYSVTATAQRR